MSLNISKGNMYEFVTHTWNTVKGECPHGCAYCYMHRWGKQKPVRFDEKELKIDLGEGNFIFVGSSCDMWAKDIPDNWIVKTLNHLQKFQNKYLLQTKNPGRILNFSFDMPSHSVICATIESNVFYKDIMKNSPQPIDRAKAMSILRGYGYDTYVTIEPILYFDLKEMVELIAHCRPMQINIGADSGRNNLPEPPKEKVLELISELEKFTTVHNKSNLHRLL